MTVVTFFRVGKRNKLSENERKSESKSHFVFRSVVGTKYIRHINAEIWGRMSAGKRVCVSQIVGLCLMCQSDCQSLFNVSVSIRSIILGVNRVKTISSNNLLADFHQNQSINL